MDTLKECEMDVDTADLKDLLPSASAVLSALPASWPYIPQLSNARSYNCSTSINPAVNKAQEHLNLLQKSLQHWLQLSENEQQLQKHGDIVPPAKKTTFADTELQIQGVRLHSSESEVKEVLPHLSPNEVIDETMALLARLERDRQMTVEKLMAEKQRVAMLRAKIDQLSYARMIMFPEAVQKEHEACAKDLEQLKWGVAHRGRTEMRLKSQVDRAELLNKQLRDEISRVTVHVPLMQEKMKLEKQAMEKIQEAQEQTNVELKAVTEQYDGVKKKSDEAFAKAERERNAMKKELDGLQAQLDRLTGQTKAAKELEEEYINNCHEYRRKIRQFEQDLPTETARHNLIKTKRAEQANKVNSLQTKLKETDASLIELTEKYSHLEEEATKERESMRAEEEQMNKVVLLKEERLKEVSLHAQELTMDNETLTKKIKNLDEQHKADIKTMVRLSKDLEATDEQLAAVREDITNAEIVYDSKKEEYTARQEACFSEEHGIKTSIEALRKTIKEEMQRKQNLRSKIEKAEVELETAKITNETQQQTCSKKEVEVRRALSEVREKVKDLQTAYDKNVEVISKLQTNIESVQADINDVKESTTQQIVELAPQHRQIKEELEKLVRKQDEMSEGKDMMQKGLEDMASSSVVIKKSQDTLQQNISILQSELDELTIQMNALQKLRDDMVNSISQITERDDNLKTHHEMLMAERNHVLQRCTAELTAGKTRNQSLASQYRKLQNQVITAKTDSLKSYDERIKLENDVRDAKQLLALQQRVHDALQQYYKYRDLYSVGELSRLQSDSKSNTHRIVQLQQLIDKALANMSRFLHSQLNSGTSNGSNLAPDRTNSRPDSDCLDTGNDTPTTSATSPVCF